MDRIARSDQTRLGFTGEQSRVDACLTLYDPAIYGHDVAGAYLDNVADLYCVKCDVARGAIFPTCGRSWG